MCDDGLKIDDWLMRLLGKGGGGGDGCGMHIVTRYLNVKAVAAEGGEKAKKCIPMPKACVECPQTWLQVYSDWLCTTMIPLNLIVNSPDVLWAVGKGNKG